MEAAGGRYSRDGIKTALRAMKQPDPRTGTVDLVPVGRVGFHLPGGGHDDLQAGRGG